MEAGLSQAEQAVEMAEKQVTACQDAIVNAEENLKTVEKQYSAALTGVDRYAGFIYKRRCHEHSS